MNLLCNKGFSAREALVFLEMLKTDNSKEAQIAASLYFRKKLAACQEPPEDFVEIIIRELISCLQRPLTEVQLNAGWALTNLACGSRQDTHRIVSANGISALKRLAEISRGEVRDQAVWALGNLAADCQRCREQVRQAQVLPMLIRFLESNDFQVLDSRKIAIWCLVNVLRSGMNDISIQNVDRLMKLLHKTIILFGTGEILCDSVWCIAYLIDHITVEGDRISVLFAQSGLVELLIDFLKVDCVRILGGSLRAIGNIITGTDEQTSKILDYDILEDLNRLIHSEVQQISRECLWILSNVAAGTVEHVTRLFSIKDLPHTIFVLCKDVSPRKRKEAYWVLVNALMGASSSIYDILMSGGMGHVLVQILRENLDGALMDRALHTIHHILRDREERRPYTLAILHRVGLVHELLKMASQRDEAAGFDLNLELAANILRVYFKINIQNAEEIAHNLNINPDLNESENNQLLDESSTNNGDTTNDNEMMDLDESLAIDLQPPTPEPIIVHIKPKRCNNSLT